MRIETSVEVNRPIDEVWSFLLNPFNMPRWGSTWLGIRQTSSGPIGLGSTFQGRWVILGFEMRMSGAITEWEPPHRIATSVIGAGLRSGLLRGILAPTATGTKFVRSTQLEPRPAFKLLWWIVWPLMVRRSHASDRKLKRLLESSQG